MFADKRLTVVGGSVRQRQLDGTRQAASKMVTARHNETAYFPNQMGNTPTSVMGFGSNQYIRTLSGIVPDQQEEALIDYYRDCYYYDNIGGATVDIVSVFPFSSWTLGGVSKEVAEVYGEAMARLNMRLMMPEISRDHLVDGDFIGTLVYDQKASTFSDILVHDRLACTVTPSPFRAVDAAINVHSSARLQQYIQTGNKFSDHILRNYPKRLVQAFLNGNVDLDPLTTLHIPRKALQDRGSASYLKRILPYYLLERTMYRGTLIEATKRQRATTHVQVGDDTWEPTSAELLAIRDMFQNTELDPLGAWVITRQGIQIQDVRPGGDFWKWTDIVDQVTPMKLRALGISEAFLSGDACLTGDTLIPTDQGLRRLDSIVAPQYAKNQWQDVEVTTKSRFTARAPVAKWVYNGYKDVYSVTTRTGHLIKATANHQFLTFNGVSNTWKRLDELQPGDLLCIDTRKLTRKQKLTFELDDYTWPVKDVDSLGRKRAENKEFWMPRDVRKPTEMTTELAYSIGFLIAEGSVSKYGAVVYNTNKEMLDKCLTGLETTFGVKRRLVYTQRKGTPYNINGVKGKTNKDNYCYAIPGVITAHYLQQLGVVGNKELRIKNLLRTGKEGLPSHAKEIPWSILEADEDSQWAFLAGFLDGDGAVGKRIHFCSSSDKLLEQLQVLLNALGIYCTRTWKTEEKRFGYSLEVNGGFVTKLVKGVTPHIVKKLPKCKNYRSFKTWALPVTSTIEFINKSRTGYSSRYGQEYQTEEGGTVVVNKHQGGAGGNYTGRKVVPYDRLDIASGIRDLLAELSPRRSDDFCDAFNQKHVFTPVLSIQYLGKDHVYDLAMEEGTEPAFVANGVVVHNSYATAEAALSVFLENMEAYREFITYKVFDSKLFPLIAVLKGLYKDKSKVRNPDSVRDLIFNTNNQKNLEIPTIQWHKSLEAKEQDNQFEVLEKLSEKGYPIPMKMWAAAANIDIGSLLSDLKEDQEIKKAIQEITGVDPDQAAQQNADQEEGGDDFRMNASARNPLADLEVRSINDPRQSRRGPALLNREFDPGIKRMSRSGKVAHAVLNEREHINKSNDLIMKASRALDDPNNREKVRRQIIARLGRMPNILGVSK